MFPLGGGTRDPARCATATGVKSATAQAASTSPTATPRMILLPLSSIRRFIRASSSGSASDHSRDPEHALHDRRVWIADKPIRALLQRDSPRRRPHRRGTRELVHAGTDQVEV